MGSIRWEFCQCPGQTGCVHQTLLPITSNGQQLGHVLFVHKKGPVSLRLVIKNQKPGIGVGLKLDVSISQDVLLVLKGIHGSVHCAQSIFCN